MIRIKSNQNCPKQHLHALMKLYSRKRLETISVSVTRYRGATTVQLRKYRLVDGNEYPTKLTLAPIRWKSFTQKLFLVTRSVEALDTDQDVNLQLHLCGNWNVSVTEGFNCVDLRQFWLPPGEDTVVATKRGIALKISEFKRLFELIEEINTTVPGFDQIQTCNERDDHQNQEDALRCSECNPNDFHNW